VRHLRGDEVALVDVVGVVDRDQLSVGEPDPGVDVRELTQVALVAVEPQPRVVAGLDDPRRRRRCRRSRRRP